MSFAHTLRHTTHRFPNLKTLLAKATPLRSGDELAGLAAATAQERAAAQAALADVPLRRFLTEHVVPYETDEVTRLIADTHHAAAFAPVASLTVGELRNFLLAHTTTASVLQALAPGLTPEMAAAVSKIMRVQDLVAVAAKCEVVTRFRNTLGLRGRLATRLQPNHPTDDYQGIAASLLDGLLHGNGDAVIGINPATDNMPTVMRLLQMLDAVRTQFDIPAQSCVLSHLTTTLRAIERGAPVDLVFQSIGGTEATNTSFGISLALLREGREAALSLKRGTVGQNVMYFETGQGSSLSANAHHGLDQQTCEARAYAVARAFEPLLVNTVVGFIGPEYLYNGKQIARAGLEDHFCGKLLGLPMGVDICYTNHAEADQDDTDTLLTLLGAAGCTYIMGVPGADDIMLHYQSTSFHDALYLRQLLGLRPAPEFEAWLLQMDIFDKHNTLKPASPRHRLLQAAPAVVARGDTPAFLSVEEGQADPWHALRQFTPARIAPGRAGHSLPTGELLRFQADHAQARDAVYSALDAARLAAEGQKMGLSVRHLHSHAHGRPSYLQRPDWGRRVADADRQVLEKEEFVPADLCIVVADGLSATAANQHAGPVLAGLLPALRQAGWTLAPLCLVRQGRVAIGDEIGFLTRAETVLVLIGERPGLSSPDSLGAYLTHRPRPGLTDDSRNCVSNIRPAGLDYAQAAEKLHYLLTQIKARQLSGVNLKDEAPLPDGGPTLRQLD